MSPRGRALGERLQLGVVRGLARLPEKVQVLLSGQRTVIIDGQRLDPQLQLVRSLRQWRGLVPLAMPGVDIAAARRRFRREATAFAGPKTPVRATRDFAIAGLAGSLAVRHYAPAAADPQPVLVFLHGGGFVFGDIETHDEPCRILCAVARMHVLSVDYRLAPEHPFPAALEDALTALRWAREHGGALGGDGRVTIGGDSAGGNLAAVAARLATREGASPAAQLLIYPATDATTPRASHDLFGEGYILTSADREAFTRLYVAGTGVSRGDHRISPLHAADLGGLPPALVVTAGFDVLRDEGEAYAHELRASGTDSRLRRFESLGHGFISLTGVVPAARRATQEIARDWRALLDSLHR
ncbi:MAG: alpha/beta hydrolase [Gemmatimonadaceae bacterium]|nr:alpha/beta hydrolase [Gemmatimonadaceae bacterium]